MSEADDGALIRSLVDVLSPPSPPVHSGDASGVSPLSANRAFDPMPSPRAQQPRAGIDSLEDLWAAYQDFGSGGAFAARVERLQPVKWQGIGVAGFLCDLEGPVSTEEFTRRYGGEKYRVTMYQLHPDRGVRTKGLSCEFSVPGAPRSRAEQQEETGSMSPSFIPSPTDTRPMLEVMDRASNRFQELSINNLEAVRSENARLSQSLEATRRELQKLVEEHHSMMSATATAHEREKSEWQQKLATLETARIREMREQAEANERKLRDEYRQRIDDAEKRGSINEQKVRDTLEADLRKERERWDQERRALQGEHERERRIMREESAAALARESQNYTARLAEMNINLTTATQTQLQSANDALANERRSSEDRFRQLNEQHSRELSALREQQREAIDRLRESWESERRSMETMRITTDKVQGLSLETRIEAIRTEASSIQRMLQTRVDELTAQKEALERRLADADRRLNKPLPEAIAEVRELATQLGFAGSPAENEEDSDEGGEDKKKGLGERIMSTIEVALPAVLERMSQPQPQQQAAIAQQRQRAQLQQQQQLMYQQQLQQQQLLQARATTMPPPPDAVARAGGAPQGVAATPQQQARRVARVAVPRPRAGWEVGTPDASIDEPVGGFAQRPPPPRVTPVGQSPVAAQPAEPVAEPAAQPAPAPVSQPKAPSPQEPVAAAPAMDSDMQDAFVKGLEEFAAQLDKSIDTETVTPTMFVNGLIERIGAEQTSMYMQMLPVDAFLSAVSQDKKKYQAINTLAGEKYVKQVWREASELLGHSAGDGQ